MAQDSVLMGATCGDAVGYFGCQHKRRALPGGVIYRLRQVFYVLIGVVTAGELNERRLHALSSESSLPARSSA